MAPEILRYEKYDAKADLWSVGAVLFEMSVGKPPFRAQNHVELLRKIERGEDKIKFPDEKKLEEGSDKTPTKVSSDVKALIRRLLKRKPLERMSFEDFFAESVLVAAAGSAAHLSPASSVSAKHDAKTSSTQTPNIPRASARQGPPIVPPSSVAADGRQQISEGDAAAVNANRPPVAPRPSSTSANRSAVAAPSPAPRTAPITAHARIPSYGDQEPPPFARRGSAAPSPPLGSVAGQTQAPPVRRSSSYTPRYGTPPEIDRAPAPPVPETVKIRDYGLGIQRAASRQATDPSTVPVSATPPSAIERFASSNSKLGSDSMEGSNDSILGKDYVVVEKRTVEINALADGESIIAMSILTRYKLTHCREQSSPTCRSEKVQSPVARPEASSRGQ